MSFQGGKRAEGVELKLTHRVHVYYNYGTRSQKTIPIMVLGLNSAIAVYMDPLGTSNAVDGQNPALPIIRNIP